MEGDGERDGGGSGSYRNQSITRRTHNQPQLRFPIVNLVNLSLSSQSSQSTPFKPFNASQATHDLSGRKTERRTTSFGTGIIVTRSPRQGSMPLAIQ